MKQADQVYIITAANKFLKDLNYDVQDSAAIAPVWTSQQKLIYKFTSPTGTILTRAQAANEVIDPATTNPR